MPRNESGIRSDLAAAQAAYLAIVNTAPAADVYTASQKVRALQKELSDYITAGSEPCEGCGKPPIGLRHVHGQGRGVGADEKPIVGFSHAYEIGCPGCGNKRAVATTPEELNGADLEQYAEETRARAVAHKLAMRLKEVRKKDILGYLRPDGKTQVTIEYRESKPHRVDSIVISTQHSPDVTLKEIKEDVIEKVIKPTISTEILDEEHIKYYVNPTGRFVVGGPMGDTGLTGRKIIVDSYGGVGSHGGGCFSGKDPSKVDRSGSYMARYIAKNIVAAGIADRVQVQMAYAIGIPEPVRAC